MPKIEKKLLDRFCKINFNCKLSDEAKKKVYNSFCFQWFLLGYYCRKFRYELQNELSKYFPFNLINKYL